MKVRSLVCLLFFSVMAVTAAAAPPNLSGKYKLDPARSEGVPAGVVQVMTIRHTGNEMTVDTKVYPPNDGLASLVTDVYTLNGQETEYKATRGMAIGKGKRIAKWTDDGAGIVVTEEATLEMPPQGMVKIPTTRKWSFSADGKEITIELTTTDPQRGEIKTKRVFTKV